MTFGRTTILALLLASLPAIAFAQGTPAGRGAATPPLLAWAPKPNAAPYIAPNRPHVKIADLTKKHARQLRWTETVVRDPGLTGRYIQMAPGEKTKTQFYAEASMFWIVQAGQMRVTLQGQEPFIASKGFVVQVPPRIQYAMETVGDTPSLRFEVTHTRAQPFYPVSETPTPIKGFSYQKILLPGATPSYGAIKPYLDFQKEIVEGGGRSPGGFVRDNETQANINRSPGVPTPPPSQLGHFHDGACEFWFVLEGNVEFLIEGVPLIRADQGDIVYVPPGRWHRSGHVGTMATRISIHPTGISGNAMQADAAGGGE